jgi:CheY-like chemotaxis protein
MLPFTLDHVARLRDAARRLVERAALTEAHVRALLAKVELDLGQSETALANKFEVTQTSLDRLLSALRAQVVRSTASVDAARRLCLHARENHLSASRLATELGDRRDRPAGERSLRHCVLVVDDVEDSRDFMSMVLHNAGFIVRTASNGLEALIAAYEMRPAVILMDLMMPVLDGAEATRLIKAVDGIRDARVIAYTGKAPVGDDGVEKLFSAVIHKPATPDRVVALVQQYANA